jgi:tetratricopeptide (TPR) repeat protein
MRMQFGVSPGSQMHPAQPHVQYSPPPPTTCPARATVANGVAVIDWGIDEVSKGRTATMNEQASILFNMSSSFSGNSTGKIDISTQPSYRQYPILALLARSIYEREGFESIGLRLASIARHAYFSRQTEVMEQASQAMLTLPLSQNLQSVAHYYQAVGEWKRGNADKAQQILNRVVDTASQPHRAQGLLSNGAIYFVQGKFEEAFQNYFAAASFAREVDLQTFVTAQRMLAVIQGLYGDHQRALSDLERLYPIFRSVSKYYPTCYHDFLNSYAIELGEVGRLVEAQNVCAITLASPFAAVYPEFAQTRDELAAKRTAATPSVVAVPALPEVIPSPQAEAEPQPARKRSTIALKLGRLCSPTRTLTLKKTKSIATGIRVRTILDQLAYSISPRSPPALL